MIKSYRQEIWKTLHKDSWEDRFVYKVSNFGRMISYLKNPEGELMGGGRVGGYLNFAVRLKNGKSKTYYIHRIVA